MSLKAIKKRQLILNTAIQYILENDLNSLTLDGIAQKASISKGGLLYHFKNKNELQLAVAEEIINEFLEAYETIVEQERGAGKHIRAFILASQQDLHAGARFNVAIQIMQNSNTNITEMYECLMNDLLQENDIDASTVQLIRLTIDGLYYSRLLNILPVSDRVTDEVIEKLLQMTRKEEH